MQSPIQYSILKKISRKPAAVFAMAIISATILIAVFAYMLVADRSPNANRMIVELGAKKVGFTKTLLLIPKQQKSQPVSLLHRYFLGKADDFRYLPVNAYTFSGQQLIVRHYIDENIEDTLVYNMQDLLPSALLSSSIDEQQSYIKQHFFSVQKFILGTDRYGRDILSRLIIGARVSVGVGLVAVLLSLSIGVLLGALAGYFGGLMDSVVMFIVNIFWSVPTLLLVFAITLTIGKGFWEIFIAIGLTMWVGTARLIRGQVMVIRELEYVTAARAIGASHFRIITRYILPNIVGPLMVIAASNFAAAILIEAGLSFLGIGIQPPQPSWGLMIKEHYNFLITNRPFAAIIPGLAIMLLVYAFNILGNALRDVLDVREN